MNPRPLTKYQSVDGLFPLRPIELVVKALKSTFNCIYPNCLLQHDMLRRGHYCT